MPKPLPEKTLRRSHAFFATFGAFSALMEVIVRRRQSTAGVQALNLAPQTTAASAATDELPRDIVELMGAISSLPIEHQLGLAPLMDKVVESTRRRRRILNLVQEALGQLRLDMKYLIFDLEATRRERDELRTTGEEPNGDLED